MLKMISKMILIAFIIVGLGINQTAQASSNDTSSDNAIDEKLGLPIVAYGGDLTTTQKAEVKKLLEVNEGQSVEELTVTGADLVKYIEDGNPNSHMYSSAKITRKDKGNGLHIDIVTPENITEVTSEMYSNALLTAGVEDADVEVASPVKVTGHSALVGIYKAYDSDGKKLDKDRTEVANEELGIATDLAKKEGMDSEKVSQLLTEIKKEIAEQNPATKEDIEKIIDDKLKSLNISLSPEDRELLVNLFNKMKDLDINFDNVKDQLSDITNDIKKKLKDVAGDKGFWQGVADFFKKLFQSIGDFFSGLF